MPFLALLHVALYFLWVWLVEVAAVPPWLARLILEGLAP